MDSFYVWLVIAWVLILLGLEIAEIRYDRKMRSGNRHG